jgi:type VI secretion system secreted protein VgrG
VSDIFGLIGSEQMSDTYRFRFVFRSGSVLDGAGYVGQSAVAALQRESGPTTYFAGVITSMGIAGRDGTSWLYTVTLEPRFSLLKYYSDYSVFQKMDVKQIVQRVFSLGGLPDPDMGGIRGDYDEIEFEMMYRESKFNFVSRLLEREGIFYFFNTGSTEETPVLGDSPQAYGGTSVSVGYYGHMVDPGDGSPFVARFARGRSLATNEVTIYGYNYERPASPVTGQAQAGSGVGSRYVFDPLATTGPNAAAHATAMLEQEQSAARTCYGISNEAGLRAGHVFTLVDGSSGGSLSGDYVVTSVKHCALVNAEGSWSYYNAFEAIPGATGFRPARTTPVPVVPGVVSAVVTGSGGSQIYVDKYGRVKVQFHWDRLGQYDEVSSAWVRVVLPQRFRDQHGWGIMSVPAGVDASDIDFLDPSGLTTDKNANIYVADSGNKRVIKLDGDGALVAQYPLSRTPIDVAIDLGRGGLIVLQADVDHPLIKYLPRVGEEVVVSFVEGSPSRPLVLGMVFNATHMPPVQLPAGAH